MRAAPRVGAAAPSHARQNDAPDRAEHHEAVNDWVQFQRDHFDEADRAAEHQFEMIRLSFPAIFWTIMA